MTKPVLLTRAEGNDGDAAALQARGLVPVIDPYIDIVTAGDDADAQRLLALLTEAGFSTKPTWLVATSANALRCWAELVGLDALSAALTTAAEASPSLRFAAVGPATADALARLGAHDVVLPETASARSLAELLMAEPAAEAIIPGGSRALGTVPEKLAEAGWSVHTGVVYETRAVHPVPASMTGSIASDFSAVVFRSPSSVHAFVDGLASVGLGTADVTQLPTICAGQTTAQAAEDAGLSVASVPSRPSADAIADAAAHLLLGIS
jgi:uroporphyrinogen-III synthase